MVCGIPNRTRKHKSCIPHPILGKSLFPGNSQIPDPGNFIVFLIPTPYFGQIQNPVNTLPDPVFSLIKLGFSFKKDNKTPTDWVF